MFTLATYQKDTLVIVADVVKDRPQLVTVYAISGGQGQAKTVDLTAHHLETSEQVFHMLAKHGTHPALKEIKALAGNETAEPPKLDLPNLLKVLECLAHTAKDTTTFDGAYLVPESGAGSFVSWEEVDKQITIVKDLLAASK